MPVTLTSGFGALAVYAACTLAAAGGIGGGSINLPIYLVLYLFSYDRAVVLSLVTVMGNYFSQVGINMQKRHFSKPSRPMIYWDCILILMPAQLGGSNIGKLIQRMLPDAISEIGAIMVLLFALVKTYFKARALLEKERIAKQDILLEQSFNTLTADLLQVKDLKITSSASSGQMDLTPQTQTALLYPKKVLFVIALVWTVYAATFLGASFFDTCSAPYGVLLSLTFPPLVACIYWGVKYVKDLQHTVPGYVLEGDIDFREISFIPPLLAFIIGILCNILGIGGGELLGPLLLWMKVDPQLTSATTSMMSLLSSSSNVIHYAVDGEIPYSIAGWLFMFGFLGGITGRNLAIYITEVYRRPSITVIALISALGVAIFLIIYNLATNSLDMDFTDICEA